MNAPPSIPIRTIPRAAEVSWFSALCSDDFQYLGVPDGSLRSSFEHCSSIVKKADELGYQNILLPSGFVPGQDALGFAFSMAVLTKQINQLVALRMGEVHPPMLARAISSLDHIAKGRLALNIISSDMPGLKESNEERYSRSDEIIQFLKQCWTQETVEFHGRFYDFHPLPTDPVKPYQQNGGPLLYFGGISPMAQALCAKHCDVFLMWPETTPLLTETMRGVATQAATHDRKIDFGLRIHVIVRETESEAREAARKLVSKLDDAKGLEIKSRSQDSKSAGVLRQDALREAADDEGYIEEHIWSGIGRARSGCGSAIVGDPDQVYAKLQSYMDLGMRSFILSGYPHLEECDLFAKYVLPRMQTCRLNEVQGRLPKETPVTPLTTGVRK
ncbi:LLM class flavin-dependent oxidoreductase [Roseimicrobium sp. ORNL1]|uniref:LLM class flavin-dependent oxidoreductase n=1 Tax=Roseimicrobium sp. ORNL1 TaxID=2711231 RepID=UPI0013E13FEB|nr:LLM class flavin-dependent oxidoreductase [Roseimicrobium sp. ORNL1]QIF04572.1 LLM class flavin-dependent oxidoreductase [Roseimicrobium sp. ORNL1]